MRGTITTELDELYPPTPAVDTILGEADDEGVHAVDLLYGETVTRPLATEDDMIVVTEDNRYIIDMQWPHDYTANFKENVNTAQENPCGYRCH